MASNIAKTKMEVLDTIEVRVALREVLLAHVSEETRTRCKDWKVSVWEDDGIAIDHADQESGELIIRFQKRRKFAENPDRPGTFDPEPEEPQDRCVTHSQLQKILAEREPEIWKGLDE